MTDSISRPNYSDDFGYLLEEDDDGLPKDGADDVDIEFMNDYRVTLPSPQVMATPKPDRVKDEQPYIQARDMDRGFPTMWQKFMKAND